MFLIEATDVDSTATWIMVKPASAQGFSSKLSQAWQRSGSMLCVGIDPDPSRFPRPLQGKADALYTFCTAIVDATAPFACAFKPQIAYFASLGAETCLASLMLYIRQHHPHLPIILDAKRGDIGSTAEHYAREAFERYQADAVTVSPYMGSDSIAPYLAYENRGVIALCRTSNPGGADLQALQVQLPRDLSEQLKANQKQVPAELPLYQAVALLAAHRWNDKGPLALVVGATYPEELASVRALAPDLPLLVPGIGAQGGDVNAAVMAGRQASGWGLMLNSSRAILYASAGEDYVEAAAGVAQKTAELIRQAAALVETNHAEHIGQGRRNTG